MDRRQALKNVAILLGGVVVGGELFLTGCKAKFEVPHAVQDLFNADQIAYLDEIAETILPKTSTPGAKDAKVGAFMTVMVRDCYTTADQNIFMTGLKDIEDKSKAKYNKSFLDSTTEQRTALLASVDAEAKAFETNRQKTEPITKEIVVHHYFTLIKQLTLLGFFTSEPGSTKALRYLPVPGKYDGNYPYKKGDKAWSLS